MNDESGQIKLNDAVAVAAWIDKQKDVVCIAVRHRVGKKTKRGGMFKVSLEALHRVNEAEEYPVLALMTPDTGALFE
jgi:hypothetical protein